jgi:hypothetical protein
MRTNWCAQSQRLFDYLLDSHDTEIDSPILNRAAAGEGGVFVGAFSKRISECRAFAESKGWSLEMTKDVRVGTQRQTGYTLKTGIACPGCDTAAELGALK